MLIDLIGDHVFKSDVQSIEQYVNTLCNVHPTLSRREIAQKIVDEQAFNNGFLGAVTSLGGWMLLPIAISVDVVKAWKTQDFMIKSIAYTYGYTLKQPDWQTALILLMSTGSLEGLWQWVVFETTATANQQVMGSLDTLRSMSVQWVVQEYPKQAARVLTQQGENVIFHAGLQKLAKNLTEMLWQVGGQKLSEKTLQKSFSTMAPFVGALISGGFDWTTTQTIGQVTIAYFENGGPDVGNDASATLNPLGFVKQG
jgi:hypothetical protein